MSFPVPGTFMIGADRERGEEGELDRFCDALISIHGGKCRPWPTAKPTRPTTRSRTPRTPQRSCAATKWDHPYSRELAAFPSPATRTSKFWPAVGRVDNVYGDRNLVCSCVGMEAYAEAK